MSECAEGEGMKTEQKYTSQGLSKALKEAGAVQKSEAWWIEYDDESGSSPPFYELVFSERFIDGETMPPSYRNDELRRWSAYDCAEIFKVLPGDIKIFNTDAQLHFCKHWSTGEYRAIYTNGYFPSEIGASMVAAEALGKLLKWCLDNGHVEKAR